MPGARRTHSLVCETKKQTSTVTTGTPKQTGIPCTTVYGLYRALPGVPGLIASIPPGSRCVGRKADIA
jgi:hypothetical protein